MFFGIAADVSAFVGWGYPQINRLNVCGMGYDLGVFSISISMAISISISILIELSSMRQDHNLLKPWAIFLCQIRHALIWPLAKTDISFFSPDHQKIIPDNSIIFRFWPDTVRAES
jgi:hypothetical protein